VGVHHIGEPVERPAELKGSPAEQGEALKVVGKARLAPGPVDAVTPVQDLVVEEVNRHLGIGKPALVDGAPLVLFAKRHSQGAVDALHAPGVDRVVARKNHPHVVALALELCGECRHHVAEPARLGERNHFAGNHEDFEIRLCQRDLHDNRHAS